jgi:hypothetical protein
MSLVVNLSYHFCQPCCDGAHTFGGVLWWDELHLPQLILYGSKQPKSQLKISFRLETFNWTWTNGRIWKQIPFINHFQCIEIKHYFHLFNSTGLIARLPLPQGNIPCNLCLFNIREFALKKGVSKNLIFFNPSFALLVLLPHPLFLFFYLFPSFLLYASPSF